VNRRIAHLELQQFFVAVERAHDPSLAGRPLVIGGRPDAPGLVAAASNEAKGFGIRPGMPLGDAASRCPDAVFLPGHFARYRLAAAAVHELVERHTAAVEWTSFDEAFVDLSSASHPNAANASSVVQRLQELLARDLLLDSAAGVAGSKTAAAVASRLARPRGLIVVLPGYDRRFLAPLDIALLPGVDQRLMARLDALDITSLEQLGNLDAAVLQEWLGRAGHVLARHARAEDDRPVRRNGPELTDRGQFRLFPRSNRRTA
jgi:DNA polymerase-4